MASSAQSSFHGIAARIDRLPVSGFHWKMMWLLAGLTFCDSVDMAVGGSIGAALQTTYDADGNPWMTLGQYSLFTSITMVGYLVGGLLSGAIADYLGRRKAVLTFGTLFTAFCFVAAASPDATFLTGCRFFMGCGLGAAFPAGYSSLTEFTPPQRRGQMQAIMGLIANCGTPTATLINMIALPLVGWRAIFIICGVVGTIIMLLCLAFLTESPRWLALKGRNEEAEKILAKVEQQIEAKKGIKLEVVPEEEIVRREQVEEIKELPWSFLFNKKMIMRTLTACLLCFTMNVLVYTIISWSPTALISRGFDASYSITLTFVMQLGIPVGVGLLTLYVEKVNRKTVLCTAYILIAILGPIWAVMPVDNPGLIMFFGFLLCFCTFTSSVTTASVYLSEPFPSACRIRGAGIANAFGRIAGIVSPLWIAACISSSVGVMGAYVINSCIAIFTAIWLAKFGVETRGKTLEEITKGLTD